MFFAECSFGCVDTGFIRKNAADFAAPSDVAADPSKHINGPLSAVLASQLDKVQCTPTHRHGPTS